MAENPAIQKFLSLLNNEDAVLDKTRGVLLLVGPTRNLQPLEDACFSPEQSWNSVVTARYTLAASSPEAVFGTLARQLVTDLCREPSSHDDSRGALREFRSEQASMFPNFVNLAYLRPHAEAISKVMPSGANAFPDLEQISAAIAHLRGPRPFNVRVTKHAPTGKATSEKVTTDPGFLAAGQRFVLFLQLDGDAEVPDAWTAFLGKLAGILPYRVVVVIAGLPKEVKLDEKAPTQKRLALEDEIDASEPIAKPEQTVAYKDNSAISDQPSTSDELGRRPYAKALARLVLHEQTVPPLSIGIHGPWGKGKSSFMEQIAKELEREEKEAQQKDVCPKTRLVTVNFNAWSYDDATEVWAGLLNKVSAKIERKLGHLGVLRANLWHAITKRTTELLWAVALPIFVFLTTVAIGWLLGVNGVEFLNNVISRQATQGDLEKALLPLLGGAGSLLFLLKRLATVTQPVSVRIANFAKLPSYSQELGFQHVVIKDLEFLRDALLARHPLARVVVFIDDLDRCSEERIMDILQAIILVLARAKFFVFLGIDTDMLYRAINKRYTTAGKPPAKTFAREYLKKILQLSFHLPEIEQPERENLLDALFSEETAKAFAEMQEETGKKQDLEAHGTDLPPLSVDLSLLRDVHVSLRKEPPPTPEEMVRDTVHELNAFRDYQGCLDDNPREIKRAVNIHRLMKLMMQIHGVPGGGLTAQRQRQLVRWVLFCTNWPSLITRALKLAEDGNLTEDVIKQCLDKPGQTVTDPLRLERLSAVTDENVDDRLPPEAIDSAFKFVARSCMLVEEPQEPKTNSADASGEGKEQDEDGASRGIESEQGKESS